MILITENAAKPEQKGATFRCRGSWSLREQELELNMKPLKSVFLHRRLREQYHLERKHLERWSTGSSLLVRFLYIWRYRR